MAVVVVVVVVGGGGSGGGWGIGWLLVGHYYPFGGIDVG